MIQLHHRQGCKQQLWMMQEQNVQMMRHAQGFTVDVLIHPMLLPHKNITNAKRHLSQAHLGANLDCMIKMQIWKVPSLDSYQCQKMPPEFFNQLPFSLYIYCVRFDIECNGDFECNCVPFNATADICQGDCISGKCQCRKGYTGRACGKALNKHILIPAILSYEKAQLTI